jgi:hypothetical protein
MTNVPGIFVGTRANGEVALYWTFPPSSLNGEVGPLQTFAPDFRAA